MAPSHSIAAAAAALALLGHAWAERPRAISVFAGSLRPELARGGSEGGSRVAVGSTARGVSQEEYSEAVPCSFHDESGDRAFCGAELPNHEVVGNFVSPSSTVLELGGRYGTTTCAIAAIQQNSGRVVTVEPDSGSWEVLQRNLWNHNCNAILFRGVVGTKHRYVSQLGDQTHALEERPDNLPPAWWRKLHPEFQVPAGLLEAQASITQTPFAGAMPLGDLEAQTGMRFDTVVADCEGCLKDFLAENANGLQGIRTIVVEADWGHYNGTSDHRCDESCVDYNALLSQLGEAGFEVVHKFRETDGDRAAREIQDCCPWIHHFVLQKKPVS